MSRNNNVMSNNITSQFDKKQIASNSIRAGYVAIIGKPNAGKSTLMNQLIGTKLSIVTHKSQTTRKRVIGIFTNNNTQIIFLDTPGILNPKYQMQSAMMNYVYNSIDESDCIIYIYDVSKYKQYNAISQNVKEILGNIAKSKKKIILLLNKIDLLVDVKKVLPIIAELNTTNIFTDIIPLSALKGNNTTDVIKTISKHLPISPFYYDAELLSTQPERFFVSEIIRENIFMLYNEEIPYSTEVNIVEFKERNIGK